jgi:Carboxypeptidase regulatory-like domain/TonB dependent receptor
VKTLISTIFVLFLASVAFAQTDRGTITGTVLDPGGAVVPAATIEAKNSATNETYNAGSTGTGNYTLASLPAGTYELTVNAAGFKKYVRPNITVQVAETVRVDAALEVGATSDTVTVNAEAALLKTESAELSHQVDYTEADAIPLFTLNGSGSEGIGNIRDPLSVLTTLPGADFSSDYEVRVNGLPSGTQAIRVEGQDATNGYQQGSNQAVQQSVDAIQEVSIQTSNFAAEYGQAGGGYINYTMKSGTNQYHGSGYDYYQNAALNSGLPFTVNAAGTGHIKNPLNRNDYGFTLGGPVRIPKLYNGKDKTFFFFNFEQFRQTTITNNLVAGAPMPQWTAGISGQDANFGPFLANGQPNPGNVENPLGPGTTAGKGALSPTGTVDNMYQLFDPTTAVYVNSATHGSGYVETPFAGNIIPYSRMDPSIVKYEAYFIKPTTAGLVNNSLQPAFSNYRHTTIPSVKMDQNVSSKIKVSGYYSATRTFSPNANGYSYFEEPAQPQVQNSQTIRVNYDQTLTPTLLLHLGIGLLYLDQPQYPPSVNAGNLLGWSANELYPANNFMPNLAGMNSVFAGGLAVGSTFGGPGVGFAKAQDTKEVKPTANANMTWVKGNHTFKWGGEMVIEGLPSVSSSRADGLYTFSGAQTQNPWEYTSTLPFLGASGTFVSGFPYASFLLGSVSGLNVSANTDSRLGRHSVGFFAQDNWKLTRKLTLEYGLRWDYTNLLQEEHGRMQSACFQCANPNLVPADSTTPLNGLVVYQKQFNQNYPFAFGPRLGVAYQINPKTVFRAGAGISYANSGFNAGLSNTDMDFYAIAAPAGTGQTIGGAPGQPNGGPGAIYFRNGNPFAPGNIYGNGPITAPLSGAGFPSITSASGCGTPPAFSTPCKPIDSPFITIDKGTGRLPRIFQWSIGLQREIMPNLIIEAAYVGNRGAWFTSPVLDPEAENGLTPAGLLAERKYGNTTGIDVHNPAQLALLTQPISSPAVIAAFPALANPNNVYPGFPSYNTLTQALRPVPQWIGVPPFLGPPLGDTWYDSLQVKLTKRYSRGLTVNASYVYQKEEILGINSASPYFTAGSGGEGTGQPGPSVVNDVNNRMQNKQLSSLDYPQVLTLTFNYTTQKNKFGGDGAGGKTLQWLSRDWTIGGVLRYQSGMLLESPSANNNFLFQMGVGSQDNPAVFSSPQGIENYVPGQPFFSVNPNSHFDPTKTLVLNPAAWTEPGPGQFGVSAPYYINNRWQRQPSESLSVGRIFRIREKYQIQVRAEFQNVFNRVFYSAPATGNGTGTANAASFKNPFPILGSSSGALSGGFGYVNAFNGNLAPGAAPRTGQIVARFTF